MSEVAKSFQKLAHYFLDLISPDENLLQLQQTAGLCGLSSSSSWDRAETPAQAKGPHRHLSQARGEITAAKPLHCPYIFIKQFERNFHS